MNREQIIEILRKHEGGFCEMCGTRGSVFHSDLSAVADEILALQNEEVITEDEVRAVATSEWKHSEGQPSYNLGLYDGFIKGAEWMQAKSLALQKDRNEPEFQKWLKDSGYEACYPEEPRYLKGTENYSTIELYNIWMDAKMQTYS